MFIFSERLKQLRKQNDMTQAQIARLLDISTRNYQGYEAGKVVPPPEKLLKISELFNVSLDYLLVFEVDPTVKVAEKTILENRLTLAARKMSDKQLINLVEFLEALSPIDEAMARTNQSTNA